MARQKNKILMFLFSLIPGAGQMYMGFMKQGLSLMTIFATLCAVGIWLPAAKKFQNQRLPFFAPRLCFCEGAHVSRQAFPFELSTVLFRLSDCLLFPLNTLLPFYHRFLYVLTYCTG